MNGHLPSERVPSFGSHSPGLQQLNSQLKETTSTKTTWFNIAFKALKAAHSEIDMARL